MTQERSPDMAFATQCPCGMTFYGAYEPAGLIYCARGIAQGTLTWNKDLAKVMPAIKAERPTLIKKLEMFSSYPPAVVMKNTIRAGFNGNFTI